MIYIFDTDSISFVVKKNNFIIKNLIEHEDDEIYISVITYAELFYGLEKKKSTRLFNEVNTIVGKMLILPFDEAQSKIYGKIRMELEKSGTSLGDMDMLIAAASLSIGAVLVTHNTKHFSKVKGIKIEDWSI
jgi:tRNA(fMet)-specific endonuclease VapC